MRLAATLLLVVTPALASAQSTAKDQWATTYCVDCHGPEAQGGFGPDLAGRQAVVGPVPASRTPAVGHYAEGQMPDARLQTIYTYLKALPQVAEPAPPRFVAPAGSPAGQVVMVNSGCGQCHEAEMATPRRALGRTAADLTFDLFADIVYRHTDHYPSGRMGNYSQDRLRPERLRTIYDFMLSLGLRASIAARLEAGPQPGTYAITVENQGNPKSGLAAEGLSLRLWLPSGMQQVKTADAGSQGITDRDAVWTIGRLAGGEKRTITIEVPNASPESFKGSRVTWVSPAPRRPAHMTLRSPVIPEQGDEALVTLPTERGQP